MSLYKTVYDELTAAGEAEPQLSPEAVTAAAGSATQFLEDVIQEFVRLNFLGPAPRQPRAPQDETALALLELDGEAPFHMCRGPHLLVLARAALHLSPDWRAYHRFCAQTIFLHQQLLREKSPTLRSQLTCMAEKEKVEAPQPLPHLLLMSNLCLSYFLYEDSKFFLSKATELLGLHVELSGAAGVRTKFQQEKKAQLFLKVTPDVSRRPEEEEEGAEVFPKDIALNDDTLLPQVKFDEDVEAAELTAGEQALVLCLSEHHKKSSASDRIVEEEVLAFVYAVLAAPKSWSLQSAALLRRSLLEAKASRKFERSIQQLEELQAKTQGPEPPVSARSPFFFTCSHPTVWKVDIDLASIYLSLNSVSSALEIFLRWDQFPEVIHCYQRLEKLSLAEKLIRERLEEKETPELLCALAEVTRDVSLFEQAWELSGSRSARAARSLGYARMVEHREEEAMSWFEASLAVNYLQPQTWFTHGCCCLQAREFGKAETAFRRCVGLEPDNAQAWSNLAAALVQLGKKEAAFTMLKEALKHNWESWRIWDNFVMVCVDVGEFLEAIRGLHRLVDLREKHWDPETLEVLVKAVTKKLPDASGDAEAHEKVRPKLVELFGRLAAKGQPQAEFWLLYAELSEDKACGFLQRALRAVHQLPGWESAPAGALEVAERAAGAFLQVEATAAQLASARMTLKGILARAKDLADVSDVRQRLEGLVAEISARQDAAPS